MKKIVIGREAFDDIMYYVNKSEFEISGFGAVEVIEGVPTVTSIYIMDQENSSAETELYGASIAKAEYQHIKSGKPGELRFWWHSHVDMGVFWSGTDMAAIEMLTENGWFVHGVFNKNYEARLAYSNNDPVSVFIDDIELEIDEELVGEESLELVKKLNAIGMERNKMLDESFANHVTIKKFKAPIYNRRSGSILDFSGTYEPHLFEDIESNNIPKYEYTKDISGYEELIAAGYRHSEILQFNSLGIFDLDDLYIHEQLKGDNYDTYK